MLVVQRLSYARTERGAVGFELFYELGKAQLAVELLVRIGFYAVVPHVGEKEPLDEALGPVKSRLGLEEHWMAGQPVFATRSFDP